MKTSEDWKQMYENKVTEYSKLIGQISAAHQYMNGLSIPNIRPFHKRVKLLCLMLENAKIDIETLKLYGETIDEMEDNGKP